jgi:hypothetical protein
MNTSLHPKASVSFRPAGLFMYVAWTLILAKCALVWWAIGHWHVPLHPARIVAPTMVFAVLATALWLTHREE